MQYHAGPGAAGPSSLVFFAECYIFTDSDLQIQNYKNEVQLKLKLHQLTSRRLKGQFAASPRLFYPPHPPRVLFYSL